MSNQPEPGSGAVCCTFCHSDKECSCSVAFDAGWHAGESRIKADRDAALAEVERLGAEVYIAECLLSRVAILGGAQSWSGREMHDWCCDYKDWSNGCRTKAWYERGHDQCGHRDRETSNEDPVPCYDPRCREAREDAAELSSEMFGLRAYQAGVERLREQVSMHQQREDEIIVALGSLGILPSEIAAAVAALRARLATLEEEASDE